MNSVRGMFGADGLICCLLLLLLSVSPLYRIFTRMSLRQAMSLGDTLLQLLFRYYYYYYYFIIITEVRAKLIFSVSTYLKYK